MIEEDKARKPQYLFGFDNEENNNDGEDNFIKLYSALMILLMTFFIVIYSYSSYSRAKFELAKDSLVKALKTIGLTNSLEIISLLKSKSKFDKNAAKERRELIISLEDISKKLQEDLGGVKVRIKRHETRIVAAANKVFAKGIEFSDDANAFLAKIINYINKDDYTNIILGVHYFPKNNTGDSNAWIVSGLRAIRLGKKFKDAGIPYRKITAIGYGNKHPLAEDDNYFIDDIDVGNNRIEIIIKKPQLKQNENYDIVV